MNAPTAAEKFCVYAAAAISSAAPGVDQAKEIGTFVSHGTTMQQMPTVIHRARSPDAA